MEIDPEQARQLAAVLVRVGLAEEQNYGFFSLDSTLGPYLKSRLTADELDGFRQRWLWSLFFINNCFKIPNCQRN
ncbi:MAG: hypothetical protein ACXWUC_03575 [Methylosarcina sp.]